MTRGPAIFAFAGVSILRPAGFTESVLEPVFVFPVLTESSDFLSTVFFFVFFFALAFTAATLTFSAVSIAED